MLNLSLFTHPKDQFLSVILNEQRQPSILVLFVYSAFSKQCRNGCCPDDFELCEERAVDFVQAEFFEGETSHRVKDSRRFCRRVLIRTSLQQVRDSNLPDRVAGNGELRAVRWTLRRSALQTHPCRFANGIAG